MNKYYLKLGGFLGSSTDAIHFGWSIVEKFILNFDRDQIVTIDDFDPKTDAISIVSLWARGNW